MRFVDELIFLENINKSEDSAMDFLYDTIDEILIEKEFEVVDNYILEFIEKCSNFTLYVGLLTITYIRREKLKNIEKLQMKAIEIGQTIMSLEDTLSTMHGLINDNVIRKKLRKEKIVNIDKTV